MEHAQLTHRLRHVPLCITPSALPVLRVGLCRLHGDIKPAGHDQDKAGQNPSLDELSKEDVKAHKEEMKNMGSGTKPFISEPPAPAMSSADHNSGARKT